MIGELRTATVLVVDDDAQDRRLLASVLEHEGCRTVCVAGASEARLALDTETFDLVVCDLVLSGESGRYLVEHVLRVVPETAVLVVSGSGDGATATELVDSGTHAYLVKPFGVDQLLISARAALRRHRMGYDEAALARRLQHEIELRTAELRGSQAGTARRLAAAIASRHDATGSHAERVSRIAHVIAARMGLDAHTCDLIATAGQLHDVGKVAVPDRVLHKRGPLTAIERRLMEAHTTVGHDLLAGSGGELLEFAATIALTHHERLDGSGYPQRLRGAAIPLEARIVSVADVAEALTSDRPCRKAHSVDKAAEILAELRGGKLDADMVDALRLADDEDWSRLDAGGCFGAAA